MLILSMTIRSMPNWGSLSHEYPPRVASVYGWFNEFDYKGIDQHIFVSLLILFSVLTSIWQG